eukprot:12312346-Alexandrium_andersonii.AAC.1
MSASLVGSEMCIRDRSQRAKRQRRRWRRPIAVHPPERRGYALPALPGACLLYTSDAADDM